MMETTASGPPWREADLSTATDLRSAEIAAEPDLLSGLPPPSPQPTQTAPGTPPARPVKCVRFNDQTEHFYIPKIVVDGPDGDVDEDDDLVEIVELDGSQSFENDDDDDDDDDDEFVSEEDELDADEPMVDFIVDDDSNQEDISSEGQNIPDELTAGAADGGERCFRQLPDAAWEAQVTELGAQLAAREQDANKLQQRLAQLEEEAAAREAAAKRLQSELDSAQTEAKTVKGKVVQLETDLDISKKNNEELSLKLTNKLEQDASERVAALEAAVAELEKQSAELRAERDQLGTELEEERRAVQEALEEALQDRDDTEARFLKEFESLRTVHADREQQLLADLEWKLREVQASAKKRMDEKDSTVRELLAKVTNLEQTVASAERDSAAARSEAEQLRGLNIEQQRALRLATRDMEQLQVNEKVLKEEVARLRAALDREKVHIDAILERHSIELAETEREYQAKIEQVKQDTASHWECRLGAELIRLQTELEQTHAEDRVAALQAQREQMQRDAQRQAAQLQKKIDAATAEVAALSQKLKESESLHIREMERLQTNSDRDIFDLRRQLDKIDMKYQEQIESTEKKHNQELERLRTEHERRMSACEQGYQLQSASTRATLELVKEQMRRDAESSLQELEEVHRKKMEENILTSSVEKRRLEAQVNQLSEALEIAKEAEPKQLQLSQQLAAVETELKQTAHSHKEALQSAQEQAKRAVRAREIELRKQAEEERCKMREELNKKAEEAINKLRLQVDSLTTQLEESKKRTRPEDRVTIEDLRRTLVAKDAALDRLRDQPRSQDSAAIQQLQASIAELEAGAQAKAVQLDKVKNDLAEREREVRDKDAVIKEREAALRKSQTNPRPQDAQKLDELRRLLKEKDEALARLHSTGRSCDEQEISALKKQVEELSKGGADSKALRAALADKEEELKRVRSEAGQVKESLKQINELKKALSEKEEAIAKLNQQLKQMEGQRQREDSNKKIKHHVAQIDELKKSLSEKEAALTRSSADLAQANKNLIEKTNKGRPEDAVQIAALKKALAEKEKALASPRPEDAAKMAEMQRTLTAKEEELGRLRETAKKPGDITEMQRALLSRDEEISRLRDALRARHGPQEAELRRQLAERDSAISRYKTEVIAMKERAVNGIVISPQPIETGNQQPVSARPISNQRRDSSSAPNPQQDKLPSTNEQPEQKFSQVLQQAPPSKTPLSVPHQQQQHSQQQPPKHQQPQQPLTKQPQQPEQPKQQQQPQLQPAQQQSILPQQIKQQPIQQKPEPSEERKLLRPSDIHRLLACGPSAPPRPVPPRFAVEAPPPPRRAPPRPAVPP